MTGAALFSLSAIVITVLYLRQRRLTKSLENEIFNRFSSCDTAIDHIAGCIRELTDPTPARLSPEKIQQLLGGLDEMADFRYRGVISDLRRDFPDLSQEDLMICSCICFNISMPVLSVYYGHGNDNSIYNRRCRLRRRLKLDDSGDSLKTFLMGRIREKEFFYLKKK